MINDSKSQVDKKERVLEIKTILGNFCETYLSEELEGYAIRLCDELGRKKRINIVRGKKEIWAASIVYVISRLNFLFDKENENYLTPDIICDFFEVNKSTIGNKATQIEKICNLTVGAEGYCSKKIMDSFTFYQTPEGFIIPKSMIGGRELIVDFVEGEEAEEIERFAKNQRSTTDQKPIERKQRMVGNNRQTAKGNRTRNRNKNQLDLLDDL